MSQPKKKQTVTGFVTDLLTGGIAASVAKTINAPIERVKIILQTQHLKPPELRYNGIVDAFVQIPKNEGFWSLWRGNGTNVIRYFPTQALNFAFKDQYKAMFLPKGSKGYGYYELAARNMCAGGAAGGTSLAFVYPMDLARTRLSGDIGKVRKYKGFGDVIAQVYKNEGGLPALYRGFVLSVAGIIPYRAVYFGGYDTLKSIFLSADQNPTFWKKWMVSQVNTTFAQYLTYPIDTVRRRLMLKGEKEGKGAAPGAKAPVVYRNAFHCAQVIVQEEGVAGLFKGAWANTIRATGGALCIVFYDELQEFLNKRKAAAAAEPKA